MSQVLEKKYSGRLQTADRADRAGRADHADCEDRVLFFCIFLFLHLLLTRIFFGSVQLYTGVFVIHRPRKLGDM